MPPFACGSAPTGSALTTRFLSGVVILKKFSRTIQRFVFLKSFQCLRVRLDMDQATKGSVLLVEDDEQVRAFIRMLLTNNGYRVLEARTGAEGWALAEREGAPSISCFRTCCFRNSVVLISRKRC